MTQQKKQDTDKWDRQENETYKEWIARTDNLHAVSEQMYRCRRYCYEGRARKLRERIAGK